MKLTSLSYFFILFIAVFFLRASPVYAQGGEEQWIFVGFTKYRDALHIENKGVSHPSPDIAWVWSGLPRLKKVNIVKR